MSVPESADELSSAELDSLRPLWLFGYASVVWKHWDLPEPAQRKCVATAKGVCRRLWQGSADHRGSPLAPGRVCTLLPCETAQGQASHSDPLWQGYLPEDFYAKDGDDNAVHKDTCTGIALCFDDAHRDAVLQHLNFRERGGYKQMIVPVVLHDEAGNETEEVRALVFVGDVNNVNFVGRAPLSEIAAQGALSHGPSGANAEYVLRLDEALRTLLPGGRAIDRHIALVARGIRHVHATTCHNVSPSTVSLVPGPSSSNLFLGSPDVMDEFVDDYRMATSLICEIAKCDTAVIMSGEAMVTLWAALRSTLSPAERVVSIDAGVFGGGIGDMAAACGATVTRLSRRYDTVFGVTDDGDANDADFDELERLLTQLGTVRLVTLVHCDTPSGTLVPPFVLRRVADIARKHGALLMVDAVSSFAACETELSCADLVCLGPQKALSLPPTLGMLGLSQRAWDRVRQRQYVGYEALLPFDLATFSRGCFPYTMEWQSIRRLAQRLREIVQVQRLDVFRDRHLRAQALVRFRARQMGLRCFAQDAVAAPSCTALLVPSYTTWDELDAALRSRGLVLGGSYGRLHGKVFRIGHMGQQTDLRMLRRALDTLEAALKQLKASD
ncbi:MAG: hypothetical protein MHM6MM_001418 [Cercozoa sp. M6MM]